MNSSVHTALNISETLFLIPVFAELAANQILALAAHCRHLGSSSGADGHEITPRWHSMPRFMFSQAASRQEHCIFLHCSIF